MNTTTPTPTASAISHQDKGHLITGIAIAFIVLDTVATILRVCSRSVQEGRWMLSDIFVPVSLLFNLGLCTANCLDVRWGAGKHIQFVSGGDFAKFTIVTLVVVPLNYLGAVTFPKLAVLDLYLHIFVDKFTRYISYGTGLLIILSAIANAIAVLGKCTPFSQTWAPVPEGSCDNYPAQYTWGPFANIVTDVIMLVLPIPAIWRLQTDTRTKIGVSITFLLGSLGLATSIARLVEFIYNSQGFRADDATWYDSDDLIWLVVEGGIYHLAACLLSLRPLFGKLLSGRLRNIFRRQPPPITHRSSSTTTMLKKQAMVGSVQKGSSLGSGSDGTAFVPSERGFNASLVTNHLDISTVESGEMAIHVTRTVQIS